MIKIRDLKFQYYGSKVFALDGINLDIPAGQYIAILGHNGSGKSTLSKVLVGLFKPNNGTVEIDGIQISRQNLKKIRSKIGMVFQNPENQFIGATVEDDIAFGLENRRIPRKEMKQMIIDYASKVNMKSMLEREPQSLSGGQKQRVAIASTLALDPKIIIFDEVTSMLDPKGHKEVIQIIESIKKTRSKTLISITHNMDEAILADMIIVLANGKVIAQGRPQDILNNKAITKVAKIDAPFIYKVSEKLGKLGIKPTYDRKVLLESLCK